MRGARNGVGYTFFMLSVEEVVRTSDARRGDNGFAFGVLGNNGPGTTALERMVAAVPNEIVRRIGRTACYFVPWLIKQRRGVTVSVDAPEGNDSRKELCHHLDIKPNANLLLISLNFYSDDSYGLAMEFFDKVAYIAALDPSPRNDFYELLDQQLRNEKGGELTPEAWEWRTSVLEQRAKDEPDQEAELNYRRAAETDALGVYMASLYTDVFYEDLFDGEENLVPIPPELLYERVRILERLFPPARGYSFQIVRQRPRRHSGR